MSPIRVGMITPSSNTVLEPLTGRVCAGLQDEVTVHYTRLTVTRISLDEGSLAQFERDAMLAAARLLADARVDVICWNGTSGAWKGLQEDVAICAAVEAETGIRATTATLGQIRAFDQLGIHRFGLAVPYADAVREAIERVYGEAGYTCVRAASLGITVNYDFSLVSLETIRSLIRQADNQAAECIVVICTNLAAGLLVEEMEAEIGKPILDSTLVALWDALACAGFGQTIAGWGQLLRTPP